MPSSIRIPSNTDPQAGDEFVNSAGSLITVLGRDGEEVWARTSRTGKTFTIKVRHCARWAATNFALPERFHNVYRNKIGVGFTTRAKADRKATTATRRAVLHVMPNGTTEIDRLDGRGFQATVAGYAA